MSSCVYFLHKTSHKEFHVIFVQSRAKKWTKKCAARAKLLFCLLDLFLLIVTFSLPSRSSLLQLPIGSTPSRLPGREKRKPGHLLQCSLAMTGSPLNKWLQFTLKIFNIAVPSSVFYKLSVLWKVLEMTASQQITVHRIISVYSNQRPLLQWLESLQDT